MVNGWLYLDKPLGLTSNQALGRLKRLLGSRKAGHAGTLDPLATGLLPVAFGEATKTMPYVIAEDKRYDFTVCWGEQRSTSDLEGEVVATSAHRPAQEAIAAILPRFHGIIEQLPPIYSALKVNGQRAHVLARQGRPVTLAPRMVTIHDLQLTALSDPAYATFSVCCSKGTYVRVLAEDIAKALGTVGHITMLRRTAVGRLTLADAVTLAQLEQAENAAHLLQPVHAPLVDTPVWRVTEAQQADLRYGKVIAMAGASNGLTLALWQEQLLAIGTVTAGMFQPTRVLHCC